MSSVDQDFDREQRERRAKIDTLLRVVRGEHVDLEDASVWNPDHLHLTRKDMAETPDLYELVATRKIYIRTRRCVDPESAEADPWMQFVNALINQWKCWPLTTDAPGKPSIEFQIYMPQRSETRPDDDTKISLVPTLAGRSKLAQHPDSKVGTLRGLLDFFEANHYESEWQVLQPLRESPPHIFEIALVLRNDRAVDEGDITGWRPKLLRNLRTTPTSR